MQKINSLIGYHLRRIELKLKINQKKVINQKKTDHHQKTVNLIKEINQRKKMTAHLEVLLVLLLMVPKK